MNEKPKPLKWDEKQYQHLYLNNGGGWKERGWINALKELGLSPIFQILETIDASDNARAIAFRREKYWIEELVRTGTPLFNVLGVSKAYPKWEKATSLQEEKVLQASPRQRRETRMTEFERLRVNAGVTIVQLAHEANVSRGTIEKIEKGQPVRAVLAARASEPSPG